MVSRPGSAPSLGLAYGIAIPSVTAALALTLLVYFPASREWIQWEIAAFIVVGLTSACAALLIRQPRARELSESSVLPLPAADWYIQLARRSGRPLGIIRAVEQGSDGRSAAEGKDGALFRSVKDALRSVDLVVPSIDSEGAVAWIVCPDTDLEGLQIVEQRLQHALANGRSSVRIGVTSFPEDGFTLDELFERAAERAGPGPNEGRSSEPAHILQSSES